MATLGNLTTGNIIVTAYFWENPHLKCLRHALIVQNAHEYTHVSKE